MRMQGNNGAEGTGIERPSDRLVRSYSVAKAVTADSAACAPAQKERGPQVQAGNDCEVVGTIYGNVGTSAFNCRVIAHLEKSEYVMAEHPDYGWVLCRWEL